MTASLIREGLPARRASSTHLPAMKGPLRATQAHPQSLEASPRQHLLTARTLVPRLRGLALIPLVLLATFACAARADAAALAVDYVHCTYQSEEPGSDEIYAVTFHGRTGFGWASNTGRVGPGNNWSNFTAGVTRGVDVHLAAWNPGDVYIVALFEQDGATNVDVATWRQFLANVWTQAMLDYAGNGIDTVEKGWAADAIVSAMHTAAIFWGGDDDLMGAWPIKIDAPATEVLYSYGSDLAPKNDLASYELEFKVIS